MTNPFSGLRVLIVGDVMLDHYVHGRTDRISPEAPVPVIEVETESWRLGGAANAAANVQSLGAEAILIGVVGNDLPGRTFIEEIARVGVQWRGVISRDIPTTVKTRIVVGTQQVCRFDLEVREVPDRVHRSLFQAAATFLPTADAVLVSDYAKGVCASAWLATVAGPPAVVDPKGREYLKRYGQGRILTPNLREARVELGDDRSAGECAQRLLDSAHASAVCVTCGGDGVVLAQVGSEPAHFPATPVTAVDVTGAGDSFAACLACGIAAGWPLQSALPAANVAGAFSVTQRGATSVTIGAMDSLVPSWRGGADRRAQASARRS